MHPRDREIIRLYKTGQSLAEVGEKFDLSKQGVRHVLKRHGVKPRSRGRPIKIAN